eukprot:m.111651 g.111651  ORF g.111651 m.111651 type:complete len:103 (-) comp13454_c0_seq1:1554-1862(-)
MCYGAKSLACDQVVGCTKARSEILLYACARGKPFSWSRMWGILDKWYGNVELTMPFTRNLQQQRILGTLELKVQFKTRFLSYCYMQRKLCSNDTRVYQPYLT